MNEKIQRSLNKTVFKETKFTTENKQAVLEKITQSEKKTHVLPVLMSSLFIIVISVVGFYFAKDFLFNEQQLVSTNDNQSTHHQLFELTKEEEKTYEKFKTNLEPKTLVNLQPVSIAKLYVHADLNQEYEVQYALYTDKDVLWSEEEDRNTPIADRGTQEQIIESFKNIDQGTFIQTSENEGYIQFYPRGNEDIMSGFSMIKNDDGVWQVAFLPIQ